MSKKKTRLFVDVDGIGTIYTEATLLKGLDEVKAFMDDQMIEEVNLFEITDHPTVKFKLNTMLVEG